MKKFAILGSGIEYTKSPFIHSEVYKALGENASYSVEDIPAGELGGNIKRLLRDYDGFNVTQPFKKEILKYIKSDCPAVNTVLSATKTGYSTDGYGFMKDLTDFAGDISGMNVLILGAGGAAEVIAGEIVRAGAKLMIYNRTKEKAVDLAARVGGSAEVDTPPEIIVNCTSVGWDRKTDPLPLNISVGHLEYAYDLIYPPWVSPFLATARLVGARTRNGWGMLVRQAIKADSIFLGRDLDEEYLAGIVMKKIAEENAK